MKAIARHGQEWLTLPEALHLLDFGCGTGTFTARLLQVLAWKKKGCTSPWWNPGRPTC